MLFGVSYAVERLVLPSCAIDMALDKIDSIMCAAGFSCLGPDDRPWWVEKTTRCAGVPLFACLAASQVGPTGLGNIESASQLKVTVQNHREQLLWGVLVAWQLEEQDLPWTIMDASVVDDSTLALPRSCSRR